MRCCRRIPLRYQGGAEIQQRITVGDQNDCRKAIRPSSSRYDGSGAGSSESKSMIAFAFLWRSISAQSVVLSSRMSPSQARMVLRSTPEDSRCVAAVWRSRYGPTFLAASEDACWTGRAAQWPTNWRMPERVIGRRSRLRKTPSPAPRPWAAREVEVIVSFSRSQDHLRRRSIHLRDVEQRTMILSRCST